MDSPHDGGVVFCLVSIITDPTSSTTLPHNQPLLLQRPTIPRKERARTEGDVTPDIQVQRPVFALPLDVTSVKSVGRGFAFGSDPEACDILIGDVEKSFGISSVQFRISPDFSQKDFGLIVRNFSRNGTTVAGFELSGRGHAVRVPSGCRVPIQAGLVYLDVLAVSHSGPAFRQNWDHYEAESQRALPGLQGLNLSTGSEVRETPLWQHQGSLRFLPAEIAWESNACYRFLGTIAFGSMGTVIQVQRLSDGAIFVAKVVKNDAAPVKVSPELDALRSLRHPRIVRLVDHAWTQGNTVLLLVLEYARFGSLASFIRKRGVTSPWLVARQVLEGVEYMHAQGFTHQDIKPDNILVFGDNPVTVKLGDLGHGSEETACPTGNFAAPELRRYDQNSDCDSSTVAWLEQKADIGAVGAVLVQMLTGEALEPGVDVTQLLGHLGPEQANLIASMLSMDPVGQPSAAACLEACEAFFQDVSDDPPRQKTPEAPVTPEMRFPQLPPIPEDSESLPATALPSPVPVLHDGRTPKDSSAVPGPEDHGRNIVSRRLSEQQGSARRSHAHDTAVQSSDISVSAQREGASTCIPDGPATTSLSTGRVQESNRVQHGASPSSTGNDTDDSSIRPFAIRGEDGWIDGLEILRHARLDRQQRGHYERLLNRVSAYTLQDSQRRLWISYADAHALCQHLGIDEELQGPLSVSRESATPHTMHPSDGLALITKYRKLRLDRHELLYRSADRWMRALDIVKANRTVDSRRWTPWPELLPIVNVTEGPTWFRGRYVSPEKALVLCRQCGLKDLEAQLRVFLRSD